MLINHEKGSKSAAKYQAANGDFIFTFNFYFILYFRLKDDFLTKGKLNVLHFTIFLSVIRQSV